MSGSASVGGSWGGEFGRTVPSKMSDRHRRNTAVERGAGEPTALTEKRDVAPALAGRLIDQCDLMRSLWQTPGESDEAMKLLAKLGVSPSTATSAGIPAIQVFRVGAVEIDRVVAVVVHLVSVNVQSRAWVVSAYKRIQMRLDDTSRCTHLGRKS